MAQQIFLTEIFRAAGIVAATQEPDSGIVREPFLFLVLSNLPKILPLKQKNIPCFYKVSNDILILSYRNATI